MKLVSKCPSNGKKPTAEEEEDGKKIRYFSCPAKLIPEQIYYWYQLFDYEQTFPGCRVPSFQKRKRRYLLALSYYRSKKIEYQIEAHKREIKKAESRGK